jgi:hypothetical protein
VVVRLADRLGLPRRSRRRCPCRHTGLKLFKATLSGIGKKYRRDPEDIQRRG